ncbi:MAG: dihydroorotate dehydrogenase [Paracoccaceae bacterium]
MTEHETELERFFAAAKAEAPMPSGDFMARVLAEAEATQAGFTAPSVRAPAGRDGLWATISGLFGGSIGLGGMATAALAGLWIGFAGADNLASYWPGTTADLGTLELVPGEDLVTLALGEGY